MPNLQHNADFERHLTLAALAHCPRDYYYVDQMRHGLMPDDPAGESLNVGILVHSGLAGLWRQRGTPKTLWTPSVALDAVDAAPEAARVDAKVLKEIKAGVSDYAEQWTGPRDHWVTLAVEPANIPPDGWTVLEGGFVAYPDLIVNAPPLHPVLVVDYKTSRWRYDPAKWEWHPELLTQCLAAEQLTGSGDIFYMVDFLQRPDRKSNVWSFPATRVWQFMGAKREVARAWVTQGLERAARLRVVHGSEPWRQEISQCETPWGLCRHHGRCFPQGE